MLRAYEKCQGGFSAQQNGFAQQGAMQEHCVCQLVSFRVSMCILSLGLHSNMPYNLDLGGRQLIPQRVEVQHRSVGRPFYSLWGSTPAHTAPAYSPRGRYGWWYARGINGGKGSLLSAIQVGRVAFI